VKIGIEMCKDLLVVLIYGPYGADNCIMVWIKTMNGDYEQQKLFCPIPSARYYG
jgi:hypothetical protein